MVNETMYDYGSRASVIREIFEYGKRRAAEIGAENVFDFSIGNPSVPAPDTVTKALEKLLAEGDPVFLHGYTSAVGDPGTRKAIADSINRKYNAGVTPDRIYMTCGAAGALSSCLKAVITSPEDEIIAFTPFFPEYTVFTRANGGKLVQVESRDGDFQIDLEKLDKAMNPHVQALIVNSPNNPSGVIYTEETIRNLAAYLEKKQAEYGHEIYLISDEPYRELVYDGLKVPYVTNYYDNSMVCYSYSKALSLPGERIGFALVGPKMKDAGKVYAAICGAGRALGYVCAPSLFQFLVRDCVDEVSDISIYKRNRDLLNESLTAYGYTCVRPDGAFYLFMKSPEPDANAFCEKAKKHELLFVPCDGFGTPGYVRISYCVQTEQIERALPAFKALAEEYGLMK